MSVFDFWKGKRIIQVDFNYLRKDMHGRDMVITKNRVSIIDPRSASLERQRIPTNPLTGLASNKL